jgi:hypothetical protein
MYGTFGTVPSKRRRIRWWQLPLLPVTLPLSVVVLFLGWVRTLRFWKVVLVFMVVWTVYGQLVVMVDRGSGLAFKDGLTEVAHDHIEDELRNLPPRDFEWGSASRDCDIGEEVRGQLEGWPLGKPWRFVLACDAMIGSDVLTNSGFPDAGFWIVRQYDWVLFDFAWDRKISSHYLFLGVLALVEVFVVPPWLVCWLVVQLVRHFRISWK